MTNLRRLIRPLSRWATVAVVLAASVAAGSIAQPRRDAGSLAGLPTPATSLPKPAFAKARSPVPTLASRDRASAGALSVPLWDFGFAILERQAAKTPDDLVFSPTSLAAVLALTLNGAGGATAAELRAALGMGDRPLPEMNRSWANLIGFINGASRSEGAVANSLWVAGGIPVLPGFVATAVDAFAAEVQNLPGDPEAGRQGINEWVSTNTGGRIPELIQVLDPATRLVLVNTVYSKVEWDWFDVASTADADFTLGDGKTVMVPTMQGRVATRVVVTDSYDALALRTHDSLSLWLVLPKGDADPESVAATLRQRVLSFQGNPGRIMGDPGQEVPAEAIVKLPRFRVEYRCEQLREDLSAMGLKSLFNPGTADLSALSNSPLFVSQVLQQALIDVSEDGIEAAAASALLAGPGGAEPPRLRPYLFNVDRPFLAILTQDNASVPLFMAIVRDPR